MLIVVRTKNRQRVIRVAMVAIYLDKVESLNISGFHSAKYVGTFDHTFGMES